MTSFPQAKTAHFAWVRPFAFTVFACLALASLSRLLLSAWLFERVAATGGLAFVLLQGIRFDLVAPGLLLAIPMALTPPVQRHRTLYGGEARFDKSNHSPWEFPDGLIVGDSIKPQHVRRLASQIDLTRPDLAALPERAIMQCCDTQAYLEQEYRPPVSESTSGAAM